MIIKLNLVIFKEITHFIKNPKIERIFKAAGYLLVVIGFTIIISLAIFSSGRPFSNKLFAITSGSMRPEIPMGSLVLAKPQKKYRVGEVITFREGSRIISHRIVSINSRGEAKTQGDANNQTDRQTIKNNQIIGRVIFNVPRLGRLLMLLKTKVGVVFLVVLPGAVLIWQEIIGVVKYLKISN